MSKISIVVPVDMIYFVRQDREIGKPRWTLSKKVKLAADSIFEKSSNVHY